MKVGLLQNELRELLEGWKTNPNVTEAQEKCWTQARKLPRTALGNDGDCLKILLEDGWDGDYVGSVAPNTARHFFWDNFELRWPYDRDLIRTGIFFHLGFYKTLGLVLKSQWERYFAAKVDWKNDKKGRSLVAILLSCEEYAPELSFTFKPGVVKDAANTDELYMIFEEHAHFASKAGYDLKWFNSLTKHMIAQNIHLMTIHSKEFEKFVQQQKVEIKLVADASQFDSEEFWLKKSKWLEVENDVGNFLLSLESQRLRNKNVEQQWMCVYGTIYIQLLEAEQKYYSLMRRLELKKVDPSLTMVEVEKLEQKIVQEEARKLKEMMQKVEMAQAFWSDMFMTLQGEALSDYRSENKKLLRKIWAYCHDDVIKGMRFTDNQKMRLREYYDKTIQIRDHEIGATIRALDVLKDILREVESLWANMGYDININMVISGVTLGEQLEWLDKRIESLERQLSDIKNELHILVVDKDINEKKSSLSPESRIENIKQEMGKRIEEYKSKYLILENELKDIFGQEG